MMMAQMGMAPGCPLPGLMMPGLGGLPMPGMMPGLPGVDQYDDHDQMKKCTSESNTNNLF